MRAPPANYDITLKESLDFPFLSSSDSRKNAHITAHILPWSGEHNADGPTLPKEGTTHIDGEEGERGDNDDIFVLCSTCCPCPLRRLGHRDLYDSPVLLVLDRGDCSTSSLPLPSSLRAFLPGCPTPVLALPRIRQTFNCKRSPLRLPQCHHPSPHLSDQRQSKGFQVLHPLPCQHLEFSHPVLPHLDCGDVQPSSLGGPGPPYVHHGS